MAVPHDLRFFKRSEWKKDPEKVDPTLCYALDHARSILGVPCSLHVAYDDSGHSEKSQHYLGKAVDLHFAPGRTRAQELAALTAQPALKGIGFYPSWLPRPGWHADTREGAPLFWYQAKGGNYVYFTDQAAFWQAIRWLPGLSRDDLLFLLEPDLLARVIWGECRGKVREEAVAIAHVILNRAAHPSWWGRDVKSVLLADKQFSCLNPSDPNLAKICAIDLDAVPAGYGTCRQVAEAALSEQTKDPTHGAVLYHAASMRTFPSWSRQAVVLARIGSHIFYGAQP